MNSHTSTYRQGKARRQKRYRQGANGKAAQSRYRHSAKAKLPREYQKRWRQRNADKIKAHRILNAAISKGLVTRGQCEVCSSDSVHAHHVDYSKPLEIQWLCPNHHARTHAS